MRYVAAFRTYTWDSGTAELSRRFFSACPGAKQVVLADETRGALGIEGYEIISHTEDTAKYGLLTHPKGNSLWYNVDYGLYILRAALPGHDYYLTSESDLAVNIDLDAMADAVARRKIDLVAHLIRPATPDWCWYESAKPIFDDPYGSVLFFVMASARALDTLMAARRWLTAQYQAGNIRVWPFCETFVPTVIRMARMTHVDVSEFADTTHLKVRPHLLITDERVNRPNSLVHSVLSAPAFIQAVIRESPPACWFDDASDLRQALNYLPLGDYAGLLYQSFKAAGDTAATEKFREFLRAQHIFL